MVGRRVVYFILFLSVGALAYAGWQVTSRTAYESAEYEVIVSDGDFEIREYPELTLAATAMNGDQQGRDGSFMRLFGYISGQNAAEQKIAMTTPVFMEMDGRHDTKKMSFVLPKKYGKDAAPGPKGDKVSIQTRPAGTYAVVRFSGRMNKELTQKNEKRLQEWIESKGWEPTDQKEAAGYDSPMTPPPLRRNEVLILLKEQKPVEAVENRD